MTTDRLALLAPMSSHLEDLSYLDISQRGYSSGNGVNGGYKDEADYTNEGSAYADEWLHGNSQAASPPKYHKMELQSALKQSASSASFPSLTNHVSTNKSSIRNC